MTQGPHSHILVTGGPSDFYGSEILAKSKFFWVCERRRDIFWVAKNTEGFFGVAKKGLSNILGILKKSSDFLGLSNSEVIVFLGMKYEPLSPPPPPLIIKICGWGPWGI